MTVGCCFIATKQRSHTDIYLNIYRNTTFPLPFEECALLLFYILYIYINIYKKAFCKWSQYSLYVSEDEFTLRLYSVMYIVSLH